MVRKDGSRRNAEISPISSPESRSRFGDASEGCLGVDAFLSLGEHWPDIAVTAFLAVVGYLLRRDISAMDKRHERAEDKFEELGKITGSLDTRITILEERHSRK